MSSRIDATKEVSNVTYNGREVPLAGTQSLLNNLCPEFSESGYAVTCHPIEKYPVNVVSRLEHKNLLNLKDRVVCTDSVGSNTAKRTLTGNQIFVGISADNYLYSSNINSYAVRETSVTVSNKMNAYGVGFDIAVLPGSTYTFSVAEKTYAIRYAFYQADGTLISYCNENYGSVVCTAPDNARWAMLIVIPNDGMQNTELTYTNLQFELGSTATPYVPHAPFTEVKLTQSGKNLLAYPYADTTKTVEGLTFTDNGDGSITLNGTATAPYLSYTLQLSDFAHALKDGMTYHLSTGTDDSNIALVCYYKNESGASVWATGGMTWKKEYTLGQVYLQVTEVATYTNMVLHPQLEAGTTATAYEPYREPTVYTKGLGQDVYGGHFNWNTGVLTIDWYFEEIDGVNKKFGNRYAWDNVVQYPVTMQYGQSSALEGNIICSHFANRNSTADRSCYSYAGGNKDIIVSMYDFATLDEANAWLVEQKNNGTPLTFCYEMYEPITVQLTPQEIIALSGTNILSSNTGITEVSGKSNPVAIIRNLEDRLAALEAAVINNA